MTNVSEVDHPLEKEDLLQIRDLFENAPIGILRTSIDGRILIVNQALVDMLGYTSITELTSSKLTITDLYEDPLTRTQVIDTIEQKQTYPHYFDSRWKRKDSTVFPCRIHGRPVLEGDNIQYFECFVEDISAQRAIEVELLASGARYRSVFENTGAGTIIIEKDTTISLANSGFANLIGYSKEEIEGKMQWTSVIATDDDRDRMLNYHNKRRELHNDAPIEYEFTIKDRHGRNKEVFLRVDLIAGTDTSVASLLDISSLKRAKRDFRESESRLSGILEAFDGYIYISTAECQLIYMNRKLKHSIGNASARSSCHKRIYGFDSPCPWCSGQAVFKGETKRYEFQHPKDNRWYYAVSSPIYESNDVVSQQQTVFIDIHERKLSEISLQKRETYLQQENLRLRENIQDRYKFGTIIGKSKVMQQTYELILRGAATNANIIIYGESGTGKELVAREIHNMSDRCNQTFLPVNCGAIPTHLMESEFFGYHKGAFTGADKNKAGYFTQSDGGTLFLDELGEIDEAMQVKLLRVLEGNGYTPLGGCTPIHPDVRIISATNSNLRPMLETGSMREDFFYRVHIIPINLPPLRDRRDDIPLLVEHFIAKHAKGAPPHFSGHDMDKLTQHDWPGNVRELENTIQRFLNLNSLEFVHTTHSTTNIVSKSKTQSDESKEQTLREATRQAQKDHILQVLNTCQWNRTRAAKVLGVQRKTLYLKMKQLDIGL